MAKYVCSNCKYQFTPKTGKVSSICPYCSKSGTVEPIKGMQDIIDDTLSEE